MKPSTNMADLHAVYERCCRNRRLSAFQLAKRQMYSSPEAENTKWWKTIDTKIPQTAEKNRTFFGDLLLFLYCLLLCSFFSYDCVSIKSFVFLNACMLCIRATARSSCQKSTNNPFESYPWCAAMRPRQTAHADKHENTHSLTSSSIISRLWTEQHRKQQRRNGLVTAERKRLF